MRPGQRVTFRVDAYPTDTFIGEVEQVRLQPTTVQNVVTYSTVIAVPNPELKLKPGMTANVTIEIARRNNVLRIPNAATRFRPTTEMFQVLNQAVPPELERGAGRPRRARRKGAAAAAAAGGGGRRPAAAAGGHTPRSAGRRRSGGAQQAAPAAQQRPQATAPARARGRGRAAAGGGGRTAGAGGGRAGEADGGGERQGGKGGGRGGGGRAASIRT